MPQGTPAPNPGDGDCRSGSGGHLKIAPVLSNQVLVLSNQVLGNQEANYSLATSTRIALEPGQPLPESSSANTVVKGHHEEIVDGMQAAPVGAQCHTLGIGVSSILPVSGRAVVRTKMCAATSAHWDPLYIAP